MYKVFHLQTISMGFRNIAKGFNLSIRPGQRFQYSSEVGSSVIKSHLDLFNSKANNWWDQSSNGSMSHLSLFDSCRIPFICDQLQSRGLTASGDQPLSGLNILDIGCGAGVLTEKLAYLGANMTGLDPVESLVEKAKIHAASDDNIKTRLEYLVSTPEEHAKSFVEKYDVAIVFLVLKHIQNRRHFLNCCLQLLKPSGSLFIMHTNRTLLGGFYHCIWAPSILNVWDKKLANYHRFMRTSEILDVLYSGNGKLVAVQGVKLNWIGRSAHFTESHSYINLMHIRKCGKQI